MVGATHRHTSPPRLPIRACISTHQLNSMTDGRLGLGTTGAATPPLRDGAAATMSSPWPRGPNLRASSSAAEAGARGKKRASAYSRTSTCSRALSCSPGACDSNGMLPPSTENNGPTISTLPTSSELSACHLVACTSQQQHSPVTRSRRTARALHPTRSDGARARGRAPRNALAARHPRQTGPSWQHRHRKTYCAQVHALLQALQLARRHALGQGGGNAA